MPRLSNYAKWTALRVEWVDSSSTAGWQSLDDVPDVGCVTIGHFFHQDGRTITLVLSRESGGDVNGSITIPKECVKSIQRLVVKS